jgi:hypothetical protein
MAKPFYGHLQHLICPLTLELPQEPVIAADGNVYEKKALARALLIKPVSPMTNEPMDTMLIPARHITNIIDDLVATGCKDARIIDWIRIRDSNERQQLVTKMRRDIHKKHMMKMWKMNPDYVKNKVMIHRSRCKRDICSLCNGIDRLRGNACNCHKSDCYKCVLFEV